MPKKTFFNLPETKRSRFLSIAIDEFARNPYDVASISNIVREAGIAKGSFYQYFEDKQDLYRYLVTLGSEQKLNIAKDLPAPDTDADLFTYVRWLFQSSVYFELREPGLAQVAYRAFVDEIPFPKMVEELRRRGPTQFFKQLLTQGIHSGDISPWTDADMAAFIMESIYYQFGRYFVERLDLSSDDGDLDAIFKDEEAQHLLDNLISILKHGFQQI
jgi:TetR/AcrR family transcriptional regulator